MKPLIQLEARGMVGALLLLLAACGTGATDDVSGQEARLTAVCMVEDASVPDGAWLCSEDRTVECADGTGTVETIYVNDPDDRACANDTLQVSDPGPFDLGTHTILVRNADGDELCSSRLQVVDTELPVLQGQTLFIWPPNHKLESISVGDCVHAVDACDGELRGEFIWASSDEPVDDVGDGSSSPDIVIDSCGQVSLRSERQGTEDGRVYRLGVRVSDRSGNTSEAECRVIVAHDQSGADAVQGDEAYRITLDGTHGQRECGVDGDSEDADAGSADAAVETM